MSGELSNSIDIQENEITNNSIKYSTKNIFFEEPVLVENNWADGLDENTQTVASKFEFLKQVKRRRREEESKNRDLRNKVSLLQKEEERILTKIICIGTLKNKIHDVKKINKDFDEELKAKEQKEKELLKNKKDKISAFKEETRKKKIVMTRNIELENHLIFLEQKKEKEMYFQKKSRELKENKQKVTAFAETLHKNFNYAMQVYQWEKEMRLIQRLDKQRLKEINKIELLKDANAELAFTKNVELEKLNGEQLIQEKLFNELRECILKN